MTQDSQQPRLSINSFLFYLFFSLSDDSFLIMPPGTSEQRKSFAVHYPCQNADTKSDDSFLTFLFSFILTFYKRTRSHLWCVVFVFISWLNATTTTTDKAKITLQLSSWTARGTSGRIEWWFGYKSRLYWKWIGVYVFQVRISSPQILLHPPLHYSFSSNLAFLPHCLISFFIPFFCTSYCFPALHTPLC